uniref:Uncharacterized protein n=1 Tax=Staphylococcus phage 184DA TaxID=3110532 RepID=A0AAU6MXP6_9CAUD
MNLRHKDHCPLLYQTELHVLSINFSGKVGIEPTFYLGAYPRRVEYTSLLPT